MERKHWDIFCAVVDNYGDIGVAWRLARRLAHDFGLEVRLWVDDLASFARIAPDLDPALPVQRLADIDIRHWPADGPPADTVPAEVVIEAFGCRLPENFEQAMAAKAVKPVWINLEYLSAEDWTRGCHRQPSPHPRLPLTKHFFFPGFGADTGGLICEQGLLEVRRQWQDDALARRAYWQLLELPEPAADEWRISLFAYENPAVTSLLAAWALGERPVTCLLPEGKALPDAARVFGYPLRAGMLARQGQLTVKVLPMTDQDSYDLLLWSCDLNLVRGEDSFVRAQWAGRPFLWHIYPQDDAAHLAKLDAFLSQYGAALPVGAAQALTAASHTWNHGADMAAAWTELAAWLPAWREHAAVWPEKLLADGDLGDRLLHFVREIG
ncbi:elongation factor P maturation arginine rhamnosyltransferase EarP [Chromobacterium haemolyticum]|uniref:Protein-arginine rhamnosyltransferase n=1 Tax=Chromobacterium fluminis TaxID=3044269 RepID=A0ABX0L631_9NEIS|nr:elongation factor P maturation arginine rhamnosyltransferase EarP [Chromobacterium haemolyticum]NHR07269.1 elongation factor P maturation arginine rhamnosyltransferase EarP [Chromobacterium haemolyticum]